MPSRQESLPLVALEAAFTARPVIATSVGGLPEVVVDEQTGLLVTPENPEALAAAVGFLLRCPARAIQMGQNARNRAQQRSDGNIHLDRYDKLYRKLEMKKPSTQALL